MNPQPANSASFLSYHNITNSEQSCSESAIYAHQCPINSQSPDYVYRSSGPTVEKISTICCRCSRRNTANPAAVISSRYASISFSISRLMFAARFSRRNWYSPMMLSEHSVGSARYSSGIFSGSGSELRTRASQVYLGTDFLDSAANVSNL